MLKNKPENKNKTKNQSDKHKDFDKIAGMIEGRLNRGFNLSPYLVGEPGVGKTHLCQQIAEQFGLDYYGTGAVKEAYTLTGYADANGKYVATSFYEAFVNGGLFLFDEMDASAPEALIVVNSALANGFIDFPAPIGRKFANEKFCIVGAGNTDGSNIRRYSARSEIDKATLDRFVLYKMDYDEELEKSMAVKRNKLEACTILQEARKFIRKNEINAICSTRSLISIMDLCDLGWNMKDAFAMTVFKGEDNEKALEMFWKDSVANLLEVDNTTEVETIDKQSNKKIKENIVVGIDDTKQVAIKETVKQRNKDKKDIRIVSNGDKSGPWTEEEKQAWEETEIGESIIIRGDLWTK